jgi:hypothetical protein
VFNIKEIINAWSISVNPTPEEKELAEIRYDICSKCEYLRKGLFETCNICGCLISKKVFSPRKPACPIKKW